MKTFICPLLLAPDTNYLMINAKQGMHNFEQLEFAGLINHGIVHECVHVDCLSSYGWL